MPEAGERELGGARPAANRLARFDDKDGPSRLGECDRGREPVRTGADDDGV